MRTLYRNGRIYGSAVPASSALVVDGPRIGWIGDEAGAGQQRADRVVDLQHGLVTPAFVDAHVHMTDTGLSLAGLDLSDARTLGEVLERVHQQARSGRGRPILGRGWDETRWPERRAPTSTELDRAGFGGAVYLARVDAHSAVVSSALLAAVRDLPGYRADGHLTRAAHDAARTEALTTLGPGRTVELQRTALRHAASLGIACVHEMAGPSISSADDLAALLALAAAEPVPEVIGYWGELFGIDTALELGAVGAAGDLFCDGSLGSHTAALHEPYQDRPDTHGMLRFETADLAEHIARCSAAGLQAGFHAIGDAAVDQVLGAVELAGGVEHRAEHRTGHRIEHAEYVHDPVRLAASGLLASMQPMFDASWGGRDGMYAERLGTRRAGELNRFAALHGAGVPLAFGSDAPVTPLGPWAAVRAAVHPHEPGSALDPARAFAAHTSGGWRAAGRRGGGALAPGVPATLAIWAGGGPVDAATGLPDLAPGHDLPACLATLRDGTPIFDGGVLAG